MTDFNDDLRLGDLDDIAKEDWPAEDNRSRFLISESNVMLVG
jgi:hypothetical protein